MDYAKAVETSVQSMKTLKSKAEGVSSSNRSVSPQVNKTTTTSNASKPVPTCYRCGIRGHAVSKCWVDRNIICHFCQKKGHMQRACKAKNKGKEGAPVPDTATPRPTSKTRSKTKSVRQVQEEELDSEDSRESFLRLVESRGVVHSPPIHVQVKVDYCVHGGGHWRRHVSDVSDHFPRAVAREGLRTLASVPQSLHKRTHPCCGLLQCQR